MEASEQKPKPDRAAARRNKRLNNKAAAALVNTLKNNPEFKGKQVNQLVSLYREGNQDLKDALQQVGNAVKALSSNSRRAFRAQENLAIRDKTKKDFPELHTTFLNMKKAGELSDLNWAQYKDLILLDDWGTIAATVAPFVLKHGSNIISKLWNAHKDAPQKGLMDHLQDLLATAFKSGDGGFESFSIPAPDSATDIRNRLYSGNHDYAVVQKNALNNAIDSTTAMPKIRGNPSYQAVNASAVGGIIAPIQAYSSRMPRQAARTMTAEYNSMMEIPLICNASGNAFVVIFPQAAAAYLQFSTTTPVQLLTLFAASDQSWDPSLGTHNWANVNNIYYAGPLNSFVNAGTITGVSLTGFHTEYIPSSSLLVNKGNLVSTWFNGLPDTSWTGPATQGVPCNLKYNDILQSPYMQRGSPLKRMAVKHWPIDPTTGTIYDVDPSDQTLSPQANGYCEGGLTEAIVYAVTGGPPGETVGNITVNYYYEFIPSTSQMPVSRMDYPLMGSATQSFLSNALEMCPALMTMTMAESTQLAAALIQSGIYSHDQLVEKLFSHAPGGLMARLERWGINGNSVSNQVQTYMPRTVKQTVVPKKDVQPDRRDVSVEKKELNKKKDLSVDKKHVKLLEQSDEEIPEISK